MGREHTHDVPRGVTPAHKLLKHGVTCAIATNNVQNPFTPFGDASLLRMANLYANVAQVAPMDFGLCMNMITAHPAKILGLEKYGLQVGSWADLVVLDSDSLTQALAQPAQAAMGFYRGFMTFHRTPAKIFGPSEDSRKKL
jgi:cytosine deaminase